MVLKNKNIIVVILSIILLFTVLKSLAFFVPDINSFGKDPEIISIEPGYLIQGEKIRITGVNFFEFPKNANKLFINNHPVRILSSNNESIEFYMPKIPLGNVRLKLYTNYMGKRSKTFYYPEPLPITIKPPVIERAETISVRPNTRLRIFGYFNTKNNLIFKTTNQKIKAETISDNECILLLPDKLPPGPFKINSYYQKYLSKSLTYIESPVSNSLTLYNTEYGAPLKLKIRTDTQRIDSLNNEFHISAFVIFQNESEIDVTEYTKFKIPDENIIKISNQKLVKPLSRGTVNI